jgi:hypothetical protein
VIYFVGALAFVFLAVGIGLAVWVARLKDEVRVWADRAAGLVLDLQRTAGRANTADVNCRRLTWQLEAVRSEHEALLRKVEAGELCDASGIALELRRLQDNDA